MNSTNTQAMSECQQAGGLDMGAALRRAFNLGQTYWQQSDSEYASQHRKADETLAQFNALVVEISAALTQPQAGEIPPPDPCFVCGDSAVSCARKYHRLQDVGNPAPAAQCELCEGTGRIDETMGGSLPGVSDAACPRCAAKIGDHSLCSAHKQPAPANGNEWQAGAAHRREGWQPIETAPKDGTEVALLFDYEVTLLDKTRPRVRAASWLGDWTIPYRLDNPPTHWMPLPAAPAHGEPGALDQGDAL